MLIIQRLSLSLYLSLSLARSLARSRARSLSFFLARSLSRSWTLCVIVGVDFVGELGLDHVYDKPVRDRNWGCDRSWAFDTGGVIW